MRNKQLEILEDLLRQINIEKNKEKEVQFTLGRCLLESVFIGRVHINFGFCCSHLKQQFLVMLLLKYFRFSVDVVHSTSSGDHVPHNVL